MNQEIPESYIPGLKHVESLTEPDVEQWLESEVKGQHHTLAGTPEDFPVDAIVNHYRYLSLAAQTNIRGAVLSLLKRLDTDDSAFNEDEVRALLSIVGELKVTSTKQILERWARARSETKSSLRPAILRAFAVLSTNRDRGFWQKLALEKPDFAGLTFQVLSRVSPSDAINLLASAPDNDGVIGSIARRLPEFLSALSLLDQKRTLEQVGKFLGRLHPAKALELEEVLQESGFTVPNFSENRRKREPSEIGEIMKNLVKNLRFESELSNA